MPYIVPQNLDLEDTIFLGLSFRQMIYLGGSGGIVFIAYFNFDGIVAGLVAFPIAALGVSLAFYKYNDRSFITLLQAFIIFLISTKFYVWRRSKVSSTQITEQIDVNTASRNKKKLDKLSSSLNIGL